MDRSNIPEAKVVGWMFENENVVISFGKDKILLNQSSGIVWELIDGVNTIQDIIDEMKKKYGEQNSEEYLGQIVEESIYYFSEAGLIVLKSENDLDGWLQYE